MTSYVFMEKRFDDFVNERIVTSISLERAYAEYRLFYGYSSRVVYYSVFKCYERMTFVRYDRKEVKND